MSNIKLPKFLYATNEAAEKCKGSEFIIHTQEPKFTALVITKKTNSNYIEVTPSGSIDVEIEYLGVTETHKILSFGDTSEKIKPVLKRMADWWKNYQKYRSSHVISKRNSKAM